jgi:hypothetical protein
VINIENVEYGNNADISLTDSGKNMIIEEKFSNKERRVLSNIAYGTFIEFNGFLLTIHVV